MTQENRSHLLNVRVEKWAPDEMHVPGLEHPRDSVYASYQGTMEDSDRIASYHGAPELWSDCPPSPLVPFHDRTYLNNRGDDGATEVWVRGFAFGDDIPRSDWSDELPVAGEVFSEKADKDELEDVAKKVGRMIRDEEEFLERGITRGFEDVAPDSHLEDLYEWQQSGDDY